MAVKTATDSPAGSVVNFATDQPAGPDFTSGPLILPGSRPAWTYTASQGLLMCRHGRIVPKLAKSWHVPGLGGNPRGPNRGEGITLARGKRGHKPIPHDLSGVVAWGAPSKPPPSCYLRRWVGETTEGRPATYWTDAWTRPTQLGHLTRWERDTEGYEAFCRVVIGFLNDGQPLSVAQIKLGIEARVGAIRRLMARDNGQPQLQRYLTDELVHLPREYAPRDILPLFDRFDKDNADESAEAAAPRKRRQKAATK